MEGGDGRKVESGKVESRNGEGDLISHGATERKLGFMEGNCSVTPLVTIKKNVETRESVENLKETLTQGRQTYDVTI